MDASVKLPGDPVSELDGRLSFDWKRQRGGSRGLLLFIGLSVMGHAFSFYLFQVVYPPAEKFSPSPSRITFLSPNDAASQSMLREIEDRIVYVNSGSRESVRETPYEKFAVEFRPSYAEYVPELRSITPPVAAVMHDPFDVPISTLPPVSPRELAVSQRPDTQNPKAEGIPVLTLGPGLVGRPVETIGNWKWAAKGIAELEGREVTLMLGVNAAGNPEHILVHAGIAGPIDTRIVTSARNLRFKPLPGSDLQWGKLLLKW